MSAANCKGSPELKLPVRSFSDISGFEVVWAGPGPIGDGFCYGSEDGRILIENDAGHELYQGSGSGEAINGVAVMGSDIVVSTRADWTAWRTVSSRFGNHAHIPGGTHGVIGTPSGYFVGPMGTAGLRVFHPATGKITRLTLPSEVSRDTYFYTCQVFGTDDRLFLICATRKTGIAVVPFLDNFEVKDDVRITGHEGWDAIDVCALGPKSFAAAALGKDGAIRLFHDIVGDPSSTPLRFSHIEGMPYRIASCNGHLIVMTNKMVCILDRLSTRFLDGDAIALEPTIAHTIPVEAIDLAIDRDRTALVVAADNSVISIDLSKKQLRDAAAQVDHELADLNPVLDISDPPADSRMYPGIMTAA